MRGQQISWIECPGVLNLALFECRLYTLPNDLTHSAVTLWCDTKNDWPSQNASANEFIKKNCHGTCTCTIAGSNLDSIHHGYEFSYDVTLYLQSDSREIRVPWKSHIKMIGPPQIYLLIYTTKFQKQPWWMQFISSLFLHGYIWILHILWSELDGWDDWLHIQSNNRREK